MTIAGGRARRLRRRTWSHLIAAGETTLLLAELVAPGAARASTDAELRATLQLSRGEIDYPIETDILQSFDEEGAPFLIQVFDGCAINDRYWVFAAGLGAEGAPLRV